MKRVVCGISIDPELMDHIDKKAEAAGISRSRYIELILKKSTKEDNENE